MFHNVIYKRLNTTSQNILYAGLGFLALFALFFLLSSTQIPLAAELKKAQYPFKTTDPSFADDSLITIEDITCDSTELTQTESFARERVLLIGDSQLEGLRNPVYKYCVLNHHELVASVLWYGSTTKSWRKSDTLSYFLKKYKPTYVFIALGLNELYAKDLENRREYIKNILASIKEAEIRYFWIGPAAWKEDKGITTLMAEINGALFYPSHKLVLERASDSMHPSRKGAGIWMDSVASYVTSLGRHGIDFSIQKDTTMKITNSPLTIIAQEK